MKPISEYELEEKELLSCLAKASSVVLYVMTIVSVDPPILAPLYTSANAWSITGYNPEAFKGRPDYWMDCVHPEDRAQYAGLAEQLLTNEEASFEFRFRHKDGHYIWIHDQFRLLRDADGTPLQIIGSWIDITARKKSETIMEQVLEEYRTIFNSTQDAMFLIDVIDADTYRFKRTNKAHQELTGCRIKHGQTPEEIVGEAMGRVLTNNYRRCYQARKAIRYNETLDLPGGKRTWHTSLTPVLRNGKVERIVGASVDITERIRSEEQIRKLTFYDRVTGLYNRTFFEEEIRRLDTTRKLPLGIIMGDVNGLKVVNDTLGHLAGDKLLKQVADILKQCCRHEDIVARWGGDEFVFLLDKADEAGAKAICDRIGLACAAAPESPIRPSISLGYAIKRHPEQRIHTVLTEAENAMYQKKRHQAPAERGALIDSLQRLLGSVCPEADEHAQNVEDLAVRFSQALRLDEEVQERLAVLARLHDIGKVGISRDVLSKQGPLTPEEWREMQRHPEIGYRFAMASPSIAHLAKALLYHHEHWDGQGYLEGLQGEEIPLLSRILAIVDAYEAMTHERSYRAQRSSAEALIEISSCAGTQFDPRLSEQFVHLMKNRSVSALSITSRVSDPSSPSTMT